MARSFPLAGFCGCGALFRWWGYYGAHLRALIWGAFSCRAAQPRGFPLGGKLSPKVTDEGATGLPNGAGEKFRWGDRWEPPFSTSTRKGWVPNRPLIRPGFAGPPSPRGEGFGGRCVPFRLQHPPPPARPAGGRAVTGVGSWAAGQAKKKESPRRAPQPEKEGPGRKNLFLPGVLSSGFLPKKAGPPPGAGWATTSQVLTCAGPNRTTYRCQRTPAGQAGPPGRCAPRQLRSRPPEGYAPPAAPWAPAQPPFPPCGERLSFPRAFWYNRGHQPNLSR